MEKLERIPHSKTGCKYNDKGRECSDCRQYKTWEHFNKNLRGFRLKCSYCRECSDAKNLHYRTVYSEKIKETHRKYRQRENGEPYRAYHREYKRIQKRLKQGSTNEQENEHTKE